MHSLTTCVASIPPVSLRTPPPFTQGRLWCGGTPLVHQKIEAPMHGERIATPVTRWKLATAQQGENGLPYPKGISYGHTSDIGHWLAMTRRRTEMEYRWCVRNFHPFMKRLSAMKRFRMKYDPSDQMKRSPRMPFGTSFASANFILRSNTSPTARWTSLRRHAAANHSPRSTPPHCSPADTASR